MYGIVGVACQESSRYSKFWADLNHLMCPDGVEVVPSLDGPLGLSRNGIVRAFLQTNAQWLLMIDDDHAVSPDFLMRLLARPTVPILGSVYTGRWPPFQPTLYGPPDHTGTFEFKFLQSFPTTGVVPVYACGASGLLVQREVYETLPEPWYKLGHSDHVGEDLYFCHAAQQAGIPVAVDLESRLGHLAPFHVWPDVVDDRWITSIRRGWMNVAIEAAAAPPLPVVVGVH